VVRLVEVPFQKAKDPTMPTTRCLPQHRVHRIGCARDLISQVRDAGFAITTRATKHFGARKWRFCKLRAEMLRAVHAGGQARRHRPQAGECVEAAAAKVEIAAALSEMLPGGFSSRRNPQPSRVSSRCHAAHLAVSEGGHPASRQPRLAASRHLTLKISVSMRAVSSPSAYDSSVS